MVRLLAFAGLCVLALGTAPRAEPVVVELFTSQGCYSCPPADRYLGELANDPEVIALALHVDYWDHLGWADTFGKAEHSARQRGYLGHTDRSHIKRYKLRGPFTPEMVLNGTESLVGSGVEMVDSRIRALKSKPAPALIGRERDQITVRPADTATGPADVVLVRYRPKATVAVLRGENAGKTMTYHNIVVDTVPLGRWRGDAPASFDVPDLGDMPAVVLVQGENLGPIFAALRLN